MKKKNSARMTFGKALIMKKVLKYIMNGILNVSIIIKTGAYYASLKSNQNMMIL